MIFQIFKPSQPRLERGATKRNNIMAFKIGYVFIATTIQAGHEEVCGMWTSKPNLKDLFNNLEVRENYKLTKKQAVELDLHLKTKIENGEVHLTKLHKGDSIRV